MTGLYHEASFVESNGTLTHSASITYECGWRQTYDVHPTQLQVLSKGRIPISVILFRVLGIKGTSYLIHHLIRTLKRITEMGKL